MKKISLKAKELLFLFLFSLILSQAFSHDVIKNDSVQKYVYKGFEHLYNFEFNKCVRIILYLKEKHPESPWTYVLATDYYWWKYLTGDEKKSTINKFNHNLKKVLEYQSTLSENERKFCISLATAFKSRLDIMEGKYLVAMKNLMKEINIISSSLGKERDYKAFYLTSGLYYYLSAAAYRDYIYLRPLLILIPKGDLNKGLQYLKLDKKDNILNSESQYFVLKVYSEIEKDYEKALIHGNKLIKTYPQNILFKHLYYKSYQKAYNKNITSSSIQSLEHQIDNNKELSKDQKEHLHNLIDKNYKN